MPAQGVWDRAGEDVQDVCASACKTEHVLSEPSLSWFKTCSALFSWCCSAHLSSGTSCSATAGKRMACGQMRDWHPGKVGVVFCLNFYSRIRHVVALEHFYSRKRTTPLLQDSSSLAERKHCAFSIGFIVPAVATSFRLCN